ncbi:MAG: Stp1/IreP family PP2C-type Ser/Thr phosphatase [Lachnospiraceae bacterium]|nr:Stp1/IreP family PP2C-type Ser/Thr phosphatase [Lachnospiraceae bacterium]
MKICSLTDIGIRREMNQDYFFSSEEPVGRLPNLFIVADGMGGHNAGEFASRCAVEIMADTARTTQEADTAGILNACVSQANARLNQYAKEHPETRGMGTTIVAAVLDGRRLTTVNVGDSRLYIIGDGIRQVTRDHSLVQEMVRMGEMDEESARIHPDKNIITRAVGIDAFIETDIFESYVEPGERILLCSDGLTNMVADDAILQILNEDRDLVSKAEYLIEIANNNGGRDNITVIVIDPECER